MRNQIRNYLFSAVILSETKDLNAKAVYEEILRFTQDDSRERSAPLLLVSLTQTVAGGGAVNEVNSPPLGAAAVCRLFLRKTRLH